MFEWLFGKNSEGKKSRPSGGKILLVGEQCIDIFNYGKCERICPEAPVPVFLPGKVIANPGMAGNVAENIKSLGFHGLEFVTNDKRFAPIKRRYVDNASDQMLLRVDEVDTVDRIPHEKLEKILNLECDLVVISDYNKGFLGLAEIELIVRKHPRVLIDSKNPKIGAIIHHLSQTSYLKLNEHEFNLAFDANYFSEFPKHTEKIIVTLGSDGAMLDSKIYSTQKVQVRDVSGAGDTFMAALAIKYNETANIDLAIKFANTAALRVVQQRGVATCAAFDFQQ